jgi:hypothetical protein
MPQPGFSLLVVQLPAFSGCMIVCAFNGIAAIDKTKTISIGLFMPVILTSIVPNLSAQLPHL